MNTQELKECLRSKTLEFEVALESGKPTSALLAIYKELKKLQYELTMQKLKEYGDAELAE